MDVLEAAEGSASSTAQAVGNDAFDVVCELCGSVPSKDYVPAPQTAQKYPFDKV